MFAAVGWRHLSFFGSFNFASLPLVYFFSPKTNGRTLEETSMLFAAHRPFVSASELEIERYWMQLVATLL